MTIYVGKSANQGKSTKMAALHVRITKYLMYIWGTYVHMCTKYEVSMSSPVARRGAHR